MAASPGLPCPPDRGEGGAAARRQTTVEPPLLHMRQITKTFAEVRANDNITLTVQAGSIHALVGENGAGKTTLMHVLYGLYQPDAGDILWRGRVVRLRSPRQARALGIGLVAQQPLLVRRATVAENLVLGLPRTPFWRPLRHLDARLQELWKHYNLAIDPRVAVWQLSGSEQQRVEILKVLLQQAQLLILDEPTTVLTPQEAQGLFDVLQRLKAEGYAIILITHKLAEVMAVADQITVLRRGRVVADVPKSAVDVQTLARLMVGAEATGLQPPERPASRPQARLAVQVEHLWAHNDRREPAVRGVSFTLHHGEILGVAGVAGNGQQELLEVLAGVRQPTGGKVQFSTPDAAAPGRAPARTLPVAYIPEERQREGLVAPLSIAENFILRHYAQPPFRHGLFLQQRLMLAQAQRAMQAYGIVAPAVTTRAGVLSGGNMQRLILARELSGQPQVIVAAQPTQGLDVVATAYIQHVLLQQRQQGSAILLVSADLDEILLLADRIMVLYAGEIMALVPRARADRTRLGLLMAGVRSL